MFALFSMSPLVTWRDRRCWLGTGRGARRGTLAWSVLRHGLALLALMCLATGCSTYSEKSHIIRNQVVTGQMAEALEELEKDGGDDPDVLNLLQRGLLYHYAGRFDDSIAAFHGAEIKIDDQFTTSISGEALAFLTNDGNRPYSGYPHEQILLHVYTALNYAFQEDLEGALVECRRVGIRLQALESVREDKAGYTDDAFAEWIAGILYAEDHDGNGAMVSARRAQRAYDEYEQLWGIPKPDDLTVDQINWGYRFGFADESRMLAEKYPELNELAEPFGPDEGEVILIYESGFVDHLEEVAFNYPILESDSSYSQPEMAVVLTQRGPRGVWVPSGNVKVKYWLRVAMPVMVSTPSKLTQARLIVGEDAASSYDACMVCHGDDLLGGWSGVSCWSCHDGPNP